MPQVTTPHISKPSGPQPQDDYFNSEFNKHEAIIRDTQNACRESFHNWLNAAVKTIRSGRKIFFFGNGGSASDAQHLATELTIRYLQDRAPIAAICLNTDTSTLTAAGNDLGFDMVFARQIEALGQEGDLAIGISTSGNSNNIINALKMAEKKGIKTVGLLGRDGGEMKNYCDINVIVPSQDTPRIQEMHITLGHIFCGALEQELDLLT